jgi:pimeloyl-ACP methyl ester carboxylesterase
MPFLTAGGHRLEFEWVGTDSPAAAVVVFLHEGLGSVAGWRDFPGMLAAALGWRGLVYSRWGHGRSDAFEGQRTVGFMHDEAVTLAGVLEALGIGEAVLFGHSDGASIALIYAARADSRARALVLEAPHVLVEPSTRAAIEAIRDRFPSSGLRERLAAQHGANTAAMFRAWTAAWLAPEFRAWSIEDLLPRVRCPLLVFQGLVDPYGTSLQVDRIVALAAGPVTPRLLDGCGHIPHRERRDEVLAETRAFLARLEAARPSRGRRGL